MKSIVMSIHPKWAEKIMDGTKRVEFRRGSIPWDTDVIFIYVTAPVKKIVGVCTCDRNCAYHFGDPHDLFKAYGRAGAVTEQEFFEYFGTRSNGHAIVFDGVWRFKNPIDPPRNWHPPQSWRYARNINDLLYRHLRGYVPDKTGGVR